MFGIPCIAAVFFGRTRGISAIAGGVMFGNSAEIGHPGKVTASAFSSSMWTP